MSPLNPKSVPAFESAKQNRSRFNQLSRIRFFKPLRLCSGRPCMSAVGLHDRGSETTTTDLIIRDAVEKDVPAIIAIYNAAVATRIATAQLEPIDIAEGRNWLSAHSVDDYPFWVAEVDGDVAGWLSFKQFLPRCAYRGTTEISVYVDEKFRRCGVARRLLEEAIARAPSLRINALVGLIFEHNEPSLKLFE